MAASGKRQTCRLILQGLSWELRPAGGSKSPVSRLPGQPGHSSPFLEASLNNCNRKAGYTVNSINPYFHLCIQRQLPCQPEPCNSLELPSLSYITSGNRASNQPSQLMANEGLVAPFKVNYACAIPTTTSWAVNSTSASEHN